MDNENMKRRYRIMTIIAAGASILLGSIATIRLFTANEIGWPLKLTVAAFIWGLFSAGLWELWRHYKRL